MDKMKYRRAFDSVSAPEGAAGRVLEAVAPRPRGGVRRMALVLCAALILSCGAALATGAAGEWLGAVIGLNGQGVPGGSIQEIGRTAEAEGLRLTLDSVAGDGVHTYFLLDIEALEGQDLSNADPDVPMEDSLYIGCSMLMPSAGGYGFRPIRIDDGSDPARARMVLKFDFGVPRNGSRLTLTVDEVSRGVWTAGENGRQVFRHEAVAEGTWEFTFRLSGALDGVHYRIPGYDFDVSISPFGMAINGVGSGCLGQDAALQLSDGTMIELTGYGLSGGERNGVTYRELVSYEFTDLIDPSRAAVFIAGGMEYPLEPAG